MDKVKRVDPPWWFSFYHRFVWRSFWLFNHGISAWWASRYFGVPAIGRWRDKHDPVWKAWMAEIIAESNKD